VKDFNTFGTEVKTLDTNWRSSRNVIAFNNGFFKHAARALQAHLRNKVPEDICVEDLPPGFDFQIMEAYQDVVQNIPSGKTSEEGHVSFTFLEADRKEDFQNSAIEAAVSHIYELLNNGFAISDICVLVRKREEGKIITNALLSGNYHPQKKALPVISNETLQLNSSPAVLFIINHLKFIQNPDDKVLESFIRLHWERHQRENSESQFNASDVFHDPTRARTWEEHLEFLSAKQTFPLYDLADELIRLLPSAIRNEQGIYIQTLLNSINHFSSRETADLALFLDQWDKSIQYDSVMVPENQNAIRVMTIHKAKGLEFKAVVIPFCNWELDASRQQNLLWCKPQNAPFNQLELVPVDYEKSLAESYFAKEYFQELMHQYIDNLNLMYVAFTRAKHSLTTFCQKKKKAPTDLVTVSDLLWFHFTSRETDQEKLPGSWDEENFKYLSGHPIPKRKQEEKTEKKSNERRPFKTCRLETIETFSFRERISIHSDSNEYFDDEAVEKGAAYGKIMHRLFEMIEVRTDLNNALKTLWFEGKINESEMEQIRTRMNKWLSKPEVRGWFDGSCKVLSEVAILDKNIRRPDRVILGKDETIVVDYKFGKEDAFKHQTQVKEYMKSIKNMGHPNVKGYIWYVPHDEIINVDYDVIQGELF
jgi:ATP-dependent exoDNAse (exonuclease V) beta subunit